MASKRTTALMAVLLILIVGYFLYPVLKSRIYIVPGEEMPLPGKNEISGLELHQDAKGRWMIDLDYFYTGEPYASFKVTLNDGMDAVAFPPHPERGQQHISFEIQRGLGDRTDLQGPYTTKQIVVEMQGYISDESLLRRHESPPKNRIEVIAKRHLDQIIEWPDQNTWLLNRALANKSPDTVLKDAVEMIDEGGSDQFSRAKEYLEWLIRKDPKFDAAYVELARVAMNTNWGPEGWHQAENLIQSALQIRPDSANAKILLGFIYTHQKRYKQAEELFAEVALSDTKNLWLWSDWGQALVMQGKVEQGMLKYREAVSRPRANDTYDRARLEAYRRLITLLEYKNDLDGLEALYKQRAEEYGPGNCYYASYARFALQQRGDFEGAINLAHKAVDGGCSQPEARNSLGMAYYVSWAKASEDQRVGLLNQAHVFLPIGPSPLYLLAKSDKTSMTIKKLIEAGESVEQTDNDKWNALAYAIYDKDYKAVSRLVKLGARLDAPTGPNQMPVALLPVVEGDVDGIRLMKKLGVDYSKLQYKGASVLDQIRRSGDRKLIELVDQKAIAL
jgi:tetratricopeptide (TPR) repeat protein